MQKILRALIVVAMLITSYLLILAWRDDYVNNPKVNVSATTIPTAVTAGDVPSAGAKANGDVPTVATTATNNTAIATTPATNLIRVSTDKYDIRINPMGGDVVYVGT